MQRVPAKRAGPAQEALPQELPPELATLVSAPLASPDDWVFEIKFDGYRMLARVEGDDVQLISRNPNHGLISYCR